MRETDIQDFQSIFQTKKSEYISKLLGLVMARSQSNKKSIPEVTSQIVTIQKIIVTFK